VHRAPLTQGVIGPSHPTGGARWWSCVSQLRPARCWTTHTHMGQRTVTSPPPGSHHAPQSRKGRNLPIFANGLSCSWPGACRCVSRRGLIIQQREGDALVQPPLQRPGAEARSTASGKLGLRGLRRAPRRSPPASMIPELHAPVALSRSRVQQWRAGWTTGGAGSRVLRHHLV
jgi:hypothetical protein